MPFIILSIVIQVAFVLHIVKTGRNTTWIWIVIMLPAAGAIAYFIVEVLPGISGSRSGRQARSKLVNIVNPNKDIKLAAHNYSISETVENSMILAAECIRKEMYLEAKEIYANCLKGIHEFDPEIMRGLAKAEFGLNNYIETRTILDKLIEKNPDYKNPDAHLLYARTLEELNETELALKEYEVLESYFPGPEATYRYAMLLKQMGDHNKSSELIDSILQEAKISGKHYNRLYKEWINKSKS